MIGSGWQVPHDRQNQVEICPFSQRRHDGCWKVKLSPSKFDRKLVCLYQVFAFVLTRFLTSILNKLGNPVLLYSANFWDKLLDTFTLRSFSENWIDKCDSTDYTAVVHGRHIRSRLLASASESSQHQQHQRVSVLDAHTDDLRLRVQCRLGLLYSSNSFSKFFHTYTV